MPRTMSRAAPVQVQQYRSQRGTVRPQGRWSANGTNAPTRNMTLITAAETQSPTVLVCGTVALASPKPNVSPKHQ
ncbi:hypothetical protein GCM10010277_80700 [Streptomyces longisporoflavus]|nr:hypothetical protein GCM10010277_80700 [Streptomyces longisporoflavus]